MKLQLPQHFLRLEMDATGLASAHGRKRLVSRTGQASGTRPYTRNRKLQESFAFFLLLLVTIHQWSTRSIILTRHRNHRNRLAAIDGRASVHRRQTRARSSTRTRIEQTPATALASHPNAGHWGGTSGSTRILKLVNYVQANKGPLDILLVGDSITQQWGSPLDQGVLNDAWRKHFAKYRTINIGIGGDKSQNVLWRLDRGSRRNRTSADHPHDWQQHMFFTPETGIVAAAKGVQMCLANLRHRFPMAAVDRRKILPCHAPGNRFYEDIKLTNAALDALHLDDDEKVTVLESHRRFHPDRRYPQKNLFTLTTFIFRSMAITSMPNV